ncbi:hypothetical protein GCM10009836_37440 [Pseudonocardia ailaonensis]|uniref:Uncharacterized protein n=1 Tax=Pseudonocardia ailaonensis TaxID=367279 RepID=A0ABN2N5S3_9PSEU
MVSWAASELRASRLSHSPVAVIAVTPQSRRKAGMAMTLRTRCDVGAGLPVAEPGRVSDPIAGHLLPDVTGRERSRTSSDELGAGTDPRGATAADPTRVAGGTDSLRADGPRGPQDVISATIS